MNVHLPLRFGGRCTFTDSLARKGAVNGWASPCKVWCGTAHQAGFRRAFCGSLRSVPALCGTGRKKGSNVEEVIVVEERVEASTRVDRRKRHGDDPTMPITVNISISLLAELDDYVVSINGSRSGIIRLAVIDFLRAKQKTRKRTRTHRIASSSAKSRVRGS